MASKTKAHSGEFYQSLGIKSRVKFFAAIFCTFAPLSVLLAAPVAPEWRGYQIVAWFLGSGLIAVGWALTGTLGRKYIWFAIPIQLAVMGMLMKWFSPARDAFSLVGPNVAGGLAVVSIILGYILYISFTNSEGAKSLRLQTEIGLAQQIHAHLVPDIDLNTGRLELYGKSAASTEVGGDLIDVAEAGGQLGMYVADVSGHGVRAGVLMSMVKSAIRMKLLHSDALDTLFGDLNDVIHQVKHEEMFVTMSAMRVGASGDVSYVSAGHPPILHYRKAEDDVVELPNQYPPLGVVPDFAFGSDAVRVAPGDVLVMLTDGLIEIDGEWDVEAGLARLAMIVREFAAEPLEHLYARVVADVSARGPVDDDRTLLLVRVKV